MMAIVVMTIMIHVYDHHDVIDEDHGGARGDRGDLSEHQQDC